jgi:hypothetical protein
VLAEAGIGKVHIPKQVSMTSRGQKPIGRMCLKLKFTFSTPVILHWIWMQMRSPHCPRLCRFFNVEGSWRGTLTEAAMRTPAINH